MRLRKLPTTERELLIEALRLVDKTGGLLNDLSAEVSRLVENGNLTCRASRRLDGLLRRRFAGHGGVGLFIAADNMRLKLPKDLQGATDDER